MACVIICSPHTVTYESFTIMQTYGLHGCVEITWCARRDLNPGKEVGNLLCYPYTTNAQPAERGLVFDRFGLLT